MCGGVGVYVCGGGSVGESVSIRKCTVGLMNKSVERGTSSVCSEVKQWGRERRREKEREERRREKERKERRREGEEIEEREGEGREKGREGGAKRGLTWTPEHFHVPHCRGLQWPSGHPPVPVES